MDIIEKGRTCRESLNPANNVIDAKTIVPGLDRFYSDHFQNIPKCQNIFQLYRSELIPPTRLSKDAKGYSGHAKAILQLYKVLTKLGILNGRFFEDRNIGKYGKFVRNTKINQRKLTSCLIGTANNKFQIVISTPRSKEIFINCLISCGIGSFNR